jgi:vesicle-associated membrane protein 7
VRVSVALTGLFLYTYFLFFRNFAYLDHVQKEFTRMYKPGRISRANAYSLDGAFKPTMRSAMHHYNVNHDKIARDDGVRALLARVDDMKSVMGRNINLLMERGEKFDYLVQKSDALVEDAQVFKKRARIMDHKRKRKICMTQAVCGCFIFIMILTLVLAATVGICGVGLQYCRAKAAVIRDAFDGDDAVN